MANHVVFKGSKKTRRCRDFMTAPTSIGYPSQLRGTFVPDDNVSTAIVSIVILTVVVFAFVLFALKSNRVPPTQARIFAVAIVFVGGPARIRSQVVGRTALPSRQQR